MKSETLSLKTAINEHVILRRTFIIQWNSWKDLLLPTNKLIEIISDPCDVKKFQSFIRIKHKTSKIIKNDYLST